jgi:hypothetical protein
VCAFLSEVFHLTARTAANTIFLLVTISVRHDELTLRAGSTLRRTPWTSEDSLRD